MVGFIRHRLVYSGAPRRSSGSFRFVWLIKALPCDRRVHSGLSLGCALGVVGFIRALGSADSFRIVSFIRVRLCGYWVKSSSFGSFGSAIGFFWFIQARPVGRCVHWGWLAS